MSFWDKFLDLLFPPRCAFCGRLLDDGEERACSSCAGALPFVEDEKVLRTGSYGVCAVTFYYENMVRQGIHGLKFGGRRAVAPVFARYMAETAAAHLSGGFDVVTFVPVSRGRLRKRGYDQSRLLAESMAQLWGVQAEPMLEKIRENQTQSTLSAPEERRANVLGAYRVCGTVEGRRFLLVDDVLTTGSTMAECASVLKLAGAESVVCAALAMPRPARQASKKG